MREKEATWSKITAMQTRIGEVIESTTTSFTAGAYALLAAPPFGARMPRNGPPYLPASDVALITDWIIEGAHDN